MSDYQDAQKSLPLTIEQIRQEWKNARSAILSTGPEETLVARMLAINARYQGMIDEVRVVQARPILERI